MGKGKGGTGNRRLIVEFRLEVKNKNKQTKITKFSLASLKELTVYLCISVDCQMEKCKWDIFLLNQCLFDKVSAT